MVHIIIKAVCVIGLTGYAWYEHQEKRKQEEKAENERAEKERREQEEANSKSRESSAPGLQKETHMGNYFY